jgi:antitoxin ParD1/3/4
MSHAFQGELARLVEQQLATGKYATEDELLIEAVRLLGDRDRRLAELREKLAPALARLDRGEGKPLDVEWVKAEGRRRLKGQ